MRLIALLLPALLASASCTAGGDDTDSGADADTDTDADTDADSDSDSDTDITRQGLFGRSGAATAAVGSYSGTEDLYLIGEDDSEICRIRYDVSWVATRKDCKLCNWAADLRFDNPYIVTESDVGCAALGLGGKDVLELAGTGVGYGYVHEYYGHADVLMFFFDSDIYWDAVSFATWDETTHAFAYDWQDGYREY